MKKIISLLLITVFALCIASCGTKGPNPDNWHNNSGINKLLAVNIEGVSINLACAFTEEGIKIYYNDRLEKELFCEVVYAQPDSDPEATAAGAVIGDANADGSGDLILNFTREDGSNETVIMYWTPEEKTFKVSE